MDNVTARNEAVSSLKQGIASGPRKSIGAGERPRNDTPHWRTAQV
ncbi:MAG: hypothetical protein NTW99_12650 [Chloroflexi bacterium]|nr:hypothetical protein [Chloroflexota bacterium]